MKTLLQQIHACRLCAQHLPHTPRPVVIARPQARLLIVGQAPGRKVHETGLPWNDLSGDQLRQWLEMDRESFYHNPRIAIMPMGLCYPGKGKSGDLPPRPECAPRWHPPLLAAMPHIRLVLLIGQYAQKGFLGMQCRATLGETVRHYQDYLPRYFPLPHPSPRNRRWLRERPWFETEVLPALRQQLQQALCTELDK